MYAYIFCVGICVSWYQQHFCALRQHIIAEQSLLITSIDETDQIFFYSLMKQFNENISFRPSVNKIHQEYQ